MPEIKKSGVLHLQSWERDPEHDSAKADAATAIANPASTCPPRLDPAAVETAATANVTATTKSTSTTTTVASRPRYWA